MQGQHPVPIYFAVRLPDGSLLAGAAVLLSAGPGAASPAPTAPRTAAPVSFLRPLAPGQATLRGVTLAGPLAGPARALPSAADAGNDCDDGKDCDAGDDRRAA